MDKLEVTLWGAAVKAEGSLAVLCAVAVVILIVAGLKFVQGQGKDVGR